MCDSRPSHALTSLRSATVKRPSHRHSFTGPAMRGRDGNTEVPRDDGPAFEGVGGVSCKGLFPVGRLLFGRLWIHGCFAKTLRCHAGSRNSRPCPAGT
jgi:hypothetical protein